MRKGQSIVVHHTGNYYTASCKMVFWLPGHLAAWLSGRLAVWPSGPYLPKTIALRPAPACLPPYTTNFLLLRLWNSTQNGRKLLLHFIVGQPGKKKSILIPVVPAKKKQDDEKPTHKMRKCLSTTKMLAKKLWRWKIIFFDVVVNDDIYYEKIKSLLLMYTQTYDALRYSSMSFGLQWCCVVARATQAAYIVKLHNTRKKIRTKQNKTKVLSARLPMNLHNMHGNLYALENSSSLIGTSPLEMFCIF